MDAKVNTTMVPKSGARGEQYPRYRSAIINAMNPEAPRQSQESRPLATIEFFDPSTQDWESVRDGIMALEEECFPGKGLGEEYLAEKFDNPQNIVILLKEGDRLLGFTYGIPDEDVEEALYVDTTELLADEQGIKQVVPMMNLLEEEARKRGYTFLTRDAAIENGYADKITKNYGDRIVETHEHPSEFGQQRYFKIRL